eukprot:XP_001696015.1 predicted protein [Chlamydomonas reinhardtii]
MELILAVLRGLPGDVELDEESAKTAVKHLQEHLNDKDAKARELAVVALCKLVTIQEDVPVAEHAPFKAIIDLLEVETNKEVRAAVVSRLPLDGSSLPLLLARGGGDDTALVGQQLYLRLRQDLALASPEEDEGQVGSGRVAASPQMRRELLWTGLQEGRLEVRKAAQELLGKWFVEDAAGDVTRLVAALGPQESPELCDLVLDQLAQLQHWQPQAWLQAAADAADPGASPRALAAAAVPAAAASAIPAALTPARAYVWLHACRQVDQLVRSSGQAAATRMAASAAQAEASAGAQAEAALDAFLPSAADMAQLCLRVAQAGPAHRYVASVLLQLSALPAFNWVDAASRAVAVEVLQQLIAAPAVSMMADETSGSNGSGNGRLPPLGCGGGGHWEDAVLTLATAVLGGGGSGGGALVEACLPLILSLAEQLSVNQETADTEAPEGAMLQVLGYLRLLMVRAGASVSPAASAPLPPGIYAAGTGNEAAAGTDQAGGGPGDGDGDQGEEEEEEEEEEEVERRISLEQAVRKLAGHAGRHASPAVRAAAVRCHVVLALRDGGLERALPAALSVMAPLLPLPGARDSRNSSGGASAAQSRKEAEWQQLPRRAAVQGLVDLSLLWGEPVVTAALRRAVAAAAGAAQVAAVTERMAAVGVMAVDGVDGGAATAMAPTEEGAQPAVPPPQAAVGVVQILLQLTEGLVRKLQGYDDYAEAAGPAADALLGCARLAAQWGSQQRLAAYSRQHQARGAGFSATAAELAELLLVRLQLARVSPALEQQPQLLAVVHMALGSVRELAAQPNAGGAAYRQLLAAAFLPAARCAMALPPPPGAAATAKCAAPELMEGMARELGAASAAAADAAAAQLPDIDEDAEDENEAEDDDVGSRPDGGVRQQPHQHSQRQQRLAEVAAAAAQLGKMVLEELALVAIERDEAAGAGSEADASQGGGGSKRAGTSRRRRSPLDTHGDKAAQAYTEELCKLPSLLLPAPVLMAVGGDDLAALGFLGRRAVRFAETELRPDKVVTEAALRKLRDLVEDVENTRQERAGSAALTEEDAAPLLEALLARLAVLPSQAQVTAEVEADETWDLTSGSGGDQAQQPAGSSRRSGGGSGSRATKSTSTAATGRATRATRSKAAATGGRTRRNDLRPVREDDDEEDEDDGDEGGDAASAGDDSSDDGDAVDVVRKRGKAAEAAAGSKARGAAAAKPSSSQTSAAAPAGERRSSRAAAAKAAEKMQVLKDNDKVAARLVRLSQGEAR